MKYLSNYQNIIYKCKHFHVSYKVLAKLGILYLLKTCKFQAISKMYILCLRYSISKIIYTFFDCCQKKKCLNKSVKMNNIVNKFSRKLQSTLGKKSYEMLI